MKPDKIIFDEADKMEVVAQKPVKTQKIVHSIRPHKGHTLFEINPVTGKCKEAVFESIDIKYSEAAVGNMSKRKKVIANDNCIYISALNKKNALIKFLKLAGSQIQKNK